MKHILLIEDDFSLQTELCILLEHAGYSTQCITDYENILEQMKTMHADLILLDINLPGVNGEILLKEFRKISNIPVIMLTSRSAEIDEVISMSYGADDYITKPYNPAILILRIAAILKRADNTGMPNQYRDICFSPASGNLTRADKEEILTKNEAIIFQLLLDRKGEIVSRDDLMTALWDNNEFINDNALSVNMSRLRGKLANLGLQDVIETRKKQGYILR